MILLALLLAAGTAVPTCAMAQPTLCATTNQLMWAKGTEAAMQAFFAKARGDYLMPDTLVWKQAREALGGPPDTPLRLKDGTLLFTACRAHSCPEKGAMVITSSGQIRVAGLLHYACTRAGCADNPRLTLFYRDPGQADGLAARAIIGWARGVSSGEAPPISRRRLS